MKARSTIIFILVTAVIFAFAAFVTFGISVGVTDIKPAENVKLGLDLTGGVYTVYQADPNIEDFDTKMEGAMSVLRNRLDAKNFTEATITRQGTDRIRVEIPVNANSTIQDPYEISKFIGTPAQLTFTDPDGNLVIEGKDIISAKAMVDNDGKYVVAFKLQSDAAKTFGEATTRLIGKPIAINIDGKEISAPTVQSAITGGEGTITGGTTGFTKQAAQELAMQIESGALPLNLTELEVRSISATLGDTALQSSIMAGLIGFVILFLFMILMYRTCGLAADIALVAYTAIVVFVISALEIQLTLPGIAGIILGIGMAVDANVVIFERFKEEFRAGKSTRASLKSGFSKAFRAIADANVTTIIAAIVLAIFGTGPIKGFAYTLIISIVVSMISALLITKGILKLLLNMFPNGTKMFVAAKKEKGGEQA